MNKILLICFLSAFSIANASVAEEQDIVLDGFIDPEYVEKEAVSKLRAQSSSYDADTEQGIDEDEGALDIISPYEIIDKQPLNPESSWYDKLIEAWRNPSSSSDYQAEDYQADDEGDRV